jgi:hypothetical protein
MEWIAISDNLPPAGVPILVTDGKSVVSCFADYKYLNRYEIVKGAKFSVDPCGVSGYEYDVDFESHEATHWMLIPELPK